MLSLNEVSLFCCFAQNSVKGRRKEKHQYRENEEKKCKFNVFSFDFSDRIIKIPICHIKRLMLTCPLVCFKISPRNSEPQGKDQVVWISLSHALNSYWSHLPWFYSSLCFLFQLSIDPANFLLFKIPLSFVWKLKSERKVYLRLVSVRFQSCVVERTNLGGISCKLI